MNHNLKRGARIVVEDWMTVRSGESLLIITDSRHMDEMREVEACAQTAGATVLLHLTPDKLSQNLHAYFDELAALMRTHQVIIGATHYSLVTTEIVKQAVQEGSRFLSLPMATNDGRSLLEYDFMTMDPYISKYMAKSMLKYINNATHLRVTTPASSDMHFRKVGRKGSYFNGRAKDNKGFASSSFEVYVPIEENQSYGRGVLDGSLGYLGKVTEPFALRLEGGRLVDIEQTADGKRLAEYMRGFEDERIYHAAEFGIGLNIHAKCAGRSYIEDESAYGTFHIGFGRNIALGGEFEAPGHFDIVFDRPSIYADNYQIMDNGVLMIPELSVW